MSSSDDDALSPQRVRLEALLKKLLLPGVQCDEMGVPHDCCCFSATRGRDSVLRMSRGDGEICSVRHTSSLHDRPCEHAKLFLGQNDEAKCPLSLSSPQIRPSLKRDQISSSKKASPIGIFSIRE
jgi:hypothetical protein